MISAARVLRSNARPVVDRGGGVRTYRLVTKAVGTREFLNGITEFDPGAALPLHWHDCEEGVIILEGEARFEADGEHHDLVVGDSTWAPAGVVHRFANRGASRLRIFWMYGSADATRTIAESGLTFAIGSEADRAAAP